MSYKNLIICILCCLYFFFPTHNSSTDAWYYAASVKYGEDLFLPHHLFHSAFLRLCYECVNFFVTVEAMPFCKAMNALFATILMAIFARFLALFGKKDIETAAWTFLVGVSFGIWRYATENETYILPLIFSLLASFYYQKHAGSVKPLLLAGSFAAIACLFHQLQIVWAAGIFISLLRFSGFNKNLFAYLLPFLIVPISYLFVYFSEINPHFSFTIFIEFVLHDFQNGSASLSIGIWNVILTILNFFRSFLQIHGSILQQIKGNYLYVFPILIFGTQIFADKSRFRRCITFNSQLSTFNFQLSTLNSQLSTFNSQLSTLNSQFLPILILQVFFAFLAMGNAEFMVMIPMLLALMFAEKLTISPKMLAFTGISLFVWNFTYSIAPQHYADQSHNIFLQKHILAHSQDTYLLQNRPMIANQLYYNTRKWHFYHLQHSPAIWLAKGQSLDSLQAMCDSILQKKGHVFVDVLPQNALLNRESVRYRGNDSTFWRKYELIAGGELRELRRKK